MLTNPVFLWTSKDDLSKDFCIFSKTFGIELSKFLGFSGFANSINDVSIESEIRKIRVLQRLLKATEVIIEILVHILVRIVLYDVQHVYKTKVTRSVRNKERKTALVLFLL